MIDYILKFPSKSAAEAFGVATGFAREDSDGNIVTTLATHEYAMIEVGDYNGDGGYWIFFRDLVGLPIPPGGEDYIAWASNVFITDEDGVERCKPKPVDTPNVWWV
jgi:hypothetical protein